MAARAFPFFERTGEFDRYDFVWTGTGRHPAWRQFVGELHPSGRFSAVEHGIGGWDISQSFSWMTAGGYLAHGRDGSVGLTRFALSFLDLIGDDLEDPDCLLRWRGDRYDVQASDRWLNRKFRHLKRRIAGMPSSLTRDSEIPHGRGRRDGSFECVAYVEEVQLSDEDLQDAEVLAALDLLDPGKMPFEESRNGLIFREQRVVPDPRPKSFWVGIPLQTCLRGLWDYRRILKFSDPSGLVAEAELEIAKLPAALRDLCTGRLRLLSAGRADDRNTMKGKIFRELPLVMEGARMDELSWIVRGRCVTHVGSTDDMPMGMGIDFDHFGHPFVDSFSAGIEGRGPRKGTRTLWLGHRFGILDRATGRRWLQDLSDPEIANVVAREFEGARHMGSLLELHPEITEDGIWVVHPDGTREAFSEDPSTGETPLSDTIDP
jgi:hypothetical protein